MKQKILFKKMPGGKVSCLACSWGCKLSEGQRGICGVRENTGGELKSLVYGKVFGGLAVDPIEKKPFYHFLPGTTALSFGTMGCNFGCLFCQNWEMSQVVKSEGLSHLSQLGYLSKKPSEIIEAALENGCKTVAYTYNEPAVFVEFAYDTMKLAKKAGLKNVFVSNGYESKESFELIKDHLDGINIDLKGATDEFYLKFCKARIGPVLENIERFWKTRQKLKHLGGPSVWVEVTTMLIEGANDSEKDIRRIAKFLKSVSPSIPWHLSQMHPDYKMTGGRVTPFETLERAYKIGREEGLKYVYAYSTEKSTDLDSTFCPKCGELLIERHYLASQGVALQGGNCGKCGERIEGVWG